MDPVLFESQDHQVDSIQVTRVEKWVLLRFLFPDKLKLKKRQWQCHLSPGVVLSQLMR